MRVVIMSGAQGAGKSHFVNSLYGSVVVCSADHYFIDETGKYNFDFRKLGEAHGQCLRKFVAILLDRQCDVLVVDNTNAFDTEIAPYYALAAAYGIKPELVTVKSKAEPGTPEYDEWLAAAKQRNLHGLDEKAIAIKDGQVRARKLPPFWDMELTEVESKTVIEE